MRTHIEDIMERTTESLEAVDCDVSIKEAVSIMFRKRVHALLVLDNAGQLAGIVTERDIARALGEYGKEAALQKVADIMSLDLIICNPQDSPQTALKLMGKHKVRNLPVVAQNGHMLGVVGIMDLVQSVLS